MAEQGQYFQTAEATEKALDAADLSPGDIVDDFAMLLTRLMGRGQYREVMQARHEIAEWLDRG